MKLQVMSVFYLIQNYKIMKGHSNLLILLSDKLLYKRVQINDRVS